MWRILRSPHCFDASSQRSRQCGLPASLEWRLYPQQTSVTSSTPQKRVIGTNSAFWTCSWAALRKRSLCSWKPKAQPSLALPAWPLAKVSPLSRYPWSSTPGELAESRPPLVTVSVRLPTDTFSSFPLILSYIRRGESHWWMKGSTPPQIAEIIIKLVKDMAAVSYSSCWSILMKKASIVSLQPYSLW